MGNLEQNHPADSLRDIVVPRPVLVLRTTTTSDKNYFPLENICDMTHPTVVRKLCSMKVN